MRRRHGRAGLAGTLFLAAALLPAGLPTAPGTARAQAQPPAESDDVDLRVRNLTGLLTPDDTFEIDLELTNTRSSAVENLRVVGTLHSAVDSRFAFQHAVDDGDLGSVLDGFAESVEHLPPGERTRLSVTRSADELGFTGQERAGVYPLRFQLRSDDDVVDEVRTAVVFTPPRVEQPVGVSFVLPVDAPPLLHADGEVATDRLVEHLGSGSRAQRLVAALASREPFPVTVALNGMLLDHAVRAARGEDPAAAQASEFLGLVRRLVQRDQVTTLGLPYGRADLVALVRGDMEAEATRHLREGRQTITRRSDPAAVAETVWPPDGLNEEALDALQEADVDSVMLREAYLSVPERRRFSPSPVRELRTSQGQRMTALVPDPWLDDVLAEPGLAAADGVAVAAQRVLAETAAAYFEQPFTDDARGLLLAPPQAWDPPPGFVGHLVDGLAEAPWLQPVGLSTLRRTVGPSGPPVRLDYPDAAQERELPASYIDTLRKARHELGALSRVLPADPQLPGSFDGLVRMAASVHYRNASSASPYAAFPVPRAEGEAVLERVLDTAHDVFSSVRVLQGPQVLIDDEGTIPVTVVNDSRVPVRVRVRLLTGRFSFPESNVELLTLQAGERRTLTFQARAITPGAQSPIGVVVEDPEGVTRLAQGRVVVRSTGVSMAALAATVGAGVFLAGWAVRQVTRRRRRAGQDTSAAEPAVQPVPPEPPATAPQR